MRKLSRLPPKYPWQRVGKVVSVPFADIDSIGVNRVKDSEGPDQFHVVIRRKRGRTFMLWSLELPKASDRDYQRFIAAEPDLTHLRDLTGIRYENRLD
jgi:hypothetical protein